MRPVAPDPSSLSPAFAGAASTLSGIGLARFAYVPLFPAMVAAGWVTGAEGGFLGAVNLAGYLIGYFLVETVGQWIIDLYGLAERRIAFEAAYDTYGLWIILIKGLTPIPYKLVTIVSGMAKYNLIVFTLASIATRGARFFLLAALLRWYGPPIRSFIEARLTLVTSTFAALIVLGFLSLRYL
jgi:membrane protein YqaA with SNARE-associated domain